MTIQIGPYQLANPVMVAPMAGVTDRPFRQLCKELGAGYAVSEMAASNALLWQSEKTWRRTNHDGEIEPKAVQIAGGDPRMMAEAAEFNILRGAQIIDINMGCPVKKVCKMAAGSALLANEPQVLAIIESVVQQATVKYGVPVTLKFRTGWDRQHKNAVTIAQMAQDAGIAMLVLHGRTRADLYHGEVEYDTIAEVKSRVTIPVIANGDIDDAYKAEHVLHYTKADGVMIGRAGQGRPWLYGEIAHYLAHGVLPEPLPIERIRTIFLHHLEQHYAFYGEYSGVRTARKHIAWYVTGLGLRGANAFKAYMNTLTGTKEQYQAVDKFFQAHIQQVPWEP